VSTLAGRRRPLPAIDSTDNEVRARAERQGFNTIVQGTAADVVKCAMLRAEDALDKAQLGARVRLIAQIHDELLFELTDARDVPRAAKVISEAMEGVCEAAGPSWASGLGIRLPVKVAAGPSWGQMQQHAVPPRT
jgi:DNA polymerase-1